MVEMLKSEDQQLLKLMRSQEIYKQGRPFALSYETSQDRQRFVARGNLDSLRLFSNQTKSFDDDPSKLPPSVEEDVKEEIAANPLAPIAGAFTSIFRQ